MLTLLLHRNSRKDITLGNLRTYCGDISHRDYLIGEYSEFPEPRIFRNEGPLYPDIYPKTIYLIRDPRAVVVSLYHMYRVMMNDTRMPLDVFVERYLSRVRIGEFQARLVRWDKHVQAWTKRAEEDGDRVMIVKYEEMIDNRRLILERVAGFLGISRTEEDFSLAVSRGSFEAMRKDEEEHGSEAYPGAMADRGRFIRRGKVDGWRDEMEINLIRRIEHEFAQTMRRNGYLPDHIGP